MKQIKMPINNNASKRRNITGNNQLAKTFRSLLLRCHVASSPGSEIPRRLGEASSCRHRPSLQSWLHTTQCLAKMSNYCFFLSSRVLGFRVHHPFRDPWRIFATWRRGIGEMGSKVGGAAPGFERFEPGTPCMRVRSRSHYATGTAHS